MTAVIADTDLLSTFGKIGRLDLLDLLFDQVYIAPAVSRELGRATQLGFIWVASVQRAAFLLLLTVDESREEAPDYCGFNSTDRSDRRARPHAYQSQSLDPQ